MKKSSFSVDNYHAGENRVNIKSYVNLPRYGLQLEGERAMATGEPREKEYQDASVPREESARGRYQVKCTVDVLVTPLPRIANT